VELHNELMNFHQTASLVFLFFSLFSITVGTFLSEFITGQNGNTAFYTGFAFFLIFMVTSMVFYGIGTRG
jgi:hypothetical protein